MAKKTTTKQGTKTANGLAKPPEQEVSRLLDGTTLGGFEIQSVINADDYSVTYRAKDVKSNEVWVLTEYFPRAIAFREGPTVRAAPDSAAVFDWGLRRFLSDGRALIKLRHPAVVEVRSVLEGNGTAYLVVPYLTYPDLAQWLDHKGGVATQEEHDRLLEPLLEVVGLLHDKKLLHLEISPATILVREDGSPLLLELAGVRVGLRHRLGLGTPDARRAFLAPEVIAYDEHVLGPRSDLYSIAATLYKMATGTSPPAVNEQSQRQDLVPAARMANQEFRSDYLGAIDTGLNMRPDDRPERLDMWKVNLTRGAPMQSNRTDALVPSNDDAPIQPDDEVDGGTEAPRANVMDDPAVRKISFAALGALAGALTGSLASIVVASIIYSSCTTDQCVAPLVPYFAAAGAVIGAFAAARRATAGLRTSSPRFGKKEL